MALAALVTDPEPRHWLTSELGVALVEISVEMAVTECRWLAMLAEFDPREGWFIDGQLSGVDWLVLRCGLTRRTARDKLRVAHELCRRPRVAVAFASGALSYTKVRAITRIVDVDEETDERLLALAETGTAADLERAVHHWKNLRDQEKGVDDYLRRYDRRRISPSRTYDGMMVVEMVMPLEEGEELLTHLDAAVDKPVEGGSAEPLSTAQGRLDALLDLVRLGRSSVDMPSGADRYLLHLVADADVVAERFGERAELVDGTAVCTATLRRLSCDAGIVRHLFRGVSEPLDIGRRTSVWTTGQRRAISVRDQGHCRWPGCWRRTADIHHMWHYGDGGPTDVGNGFSRAPSTTPVSTSVGSPSPATPMASWPSTVPTAPCSARAELATAADRRSYVTEIAAQSPKAA